MKIACIGGGTGGFVFCNLDEAPRSRPRDRGVRAQSSRRDIRLGGRLLRPDGRQSESQRPDFGERDRRRICALGRHRSSYRWRMPSLLGARFHRHRPQAFARHPRRTARRSLASGSSMEPSAMPTRRVGRLRPVDRCRRHQQPSPRYARRGLRSRRSTSAPTNSSGSAPPRRSTPSPSLSSRPRPDGSGLTPIASRPIARPSSSNVRPSDLGRARLRHDGPGGVIDAVEQIFADTSRPAMAESNAAHLPRIGGLAQFSPDPLRAVERRQCQS